MAAGWWQRWRTRRTLERRAIPDALWTATLQRHPFLAERSDDDRRRLRETATLFLAQKEFTGAQGLEVTDAMAVSIAAQAALPVLALGLDWYDGFVGIVVHADDVVARREVMDEHGIVHAYDEELVGEAVVGGPVMLAWSAVDEADPEIDPSFNVVIHEFAHVIDMRTGGADGLPPLPDRAAREHWIEVFDTAYASFVARVERGRGTLLDPYAAEGPEEFFAVASESFFIAPTAFAAEHPALYRLFAGFYRQDPAAWQAANRPEPEPVEEDIDAEARRPLNPWTG